MMTTGDPLPPPDLSEAGSRESAPADVSEAATRESAPPNTHDTVFDLLSAEPSVRTVLDIPCGSGAFTRRLLDTRSRFAVLAADLHSHPAIPEAVFTEADMNERLPFEDGQFDAIVSIEGIEHIQRPFDFVKECHRILRPGGCLFISTPNISSIRSRWRWFLTGFHNKSKCPLDEERPAPRHHVNMLSFPQLRYMLHTNGFAIETIATNRIKAVNWAYAPWVPIQMLAGRRAFRRGARNEDHRRQIREITRQMRSVPLLFGETTIIAARRRATRRTTASRTPSANAQPPDHV